MVQEKTNNDTIQSISVVSLDLAYMVLVDELIMLDIFLFLLLYMESYRYWYYSYISTFDSQVGTGGPGGSLVTPPIFQKGGLPPPIIRLNT